MKNHNIKNIITRNSAILSVVWAALVAACAYTICYKITVHERKRVKSVALAMIDKDLAYRFWSSHQGGVYVDAKLNRPNPYLNIPNRDVKTEEGRSLTLMNPAYMTRQVHEMSGQKFGIKGHITSLKPLRPENKPDEWERKALLSFNDKDAKTFSEVVTTGDTRSFRVIKPLVTQQSCLKCHDHQGYRVGDIRGGLSAAVPFLGNTDELIVVVVSMFFVLFGGLLIIRISSKKIYHYMSENLNLITKLNSSNCELQEHKSNLEMDVDERTNELVEANNKLIQQVEISKNAEAKANEANNVKNEFMRTMSHEFRTPLNIILGYSQILAGDSSVKAREASESIYKEGKTLLNIINSILRITSFDSCNMVKNNYLNLQSVLGNTINAVQASHKGEFHISQNSILGSETVRADETLLHTAFICLLSCTGLVSKSGEIFVDCEKFSDNKISIRFMCTDAPHINLPHEAIFEPYALSEFISKDEAGFGLYLTKKILDKMGFELQVENNNSGNIAFLVKADSFAESVADNGDAYPLEPADPDEFKQLLGEELYISINEMLAVGNIGQISKELDTFSENNPHSCKNLQLLRQLLNQFELDKASELLTGGNDDATR